jgi:dolichol-phosphate mannosyltransferase
MKPHETPYYSVVIPFKNEEENIETLIHEVEAAMTKTSRPHEIIAIDDGSTDGTLFILKKIHSHYPSLRILSFDRNYGQTSAFDAGFKEARGRFIITLDGDGQNNPEDIPRLIAHEEKADLVCGKRMKRKDPWHKKWISRAANTVRSRFCQDGVSDTGCSLKLYRKEALDKIKLFHGMHRFLPALFHIEKFRVLEVEVSHRERKHGKTKYHFFNRSLNTLFDMLAVRWMRSRALHWKIKEKM